MTPKNSFTMLNESQYEVIKDIESMIEDNNIEISTRISLVKLGKSYKDCFAVVEKNIDKIIEYVRHIEDGIVKDIAIAMVMEHIEDFERKLDYVDEF